MGLVSEILNLAASDVAVVPANTGLEVVEDISVSRGEAI